MKTKLFFFRETPTSPVDEYRAKFRPLGRVFAKIALKVEPCCLFILHFPYFGVNLYFLGTETDQTTVSHVNNAKQFRHK